MWREDLVATVERLKHFSWGPSHCRRVYSMATDLARKEGDPYDDDVLYAVSWLHDVGTFPEHVIEGESGPECSARAAERILPEIGFPEGKIGNVTRIIRAHNFDDPPLPMVESRVFHDADILDFLGAIGVTRLLAIVGLEDWTPDTRSAVDTMREFAEDLPRKLVVAEARHLAHHRKAETQAFLAALDEETGQLVAL